MCLCVCVCEGEREKVRYCLGFGGVLFIGMLARG